MFSEKRLDKEDIKAIVPPDHPNFSEDAGALSAAIDGLKAAGKQKNDSRNSKTIR